MLRAVCTQRRCPVHPASQSRYHGAMPEGFVQQVYTLLAWDFASGKCFELDQRKHLNWIPHCSPASTAPEHLGSFGRPYLPLTFLWVLLLVVFFLLCCLRRLPVKQNCESIMWAWLKAGAHPKKWFPFGSPEPPPPTRLPSK